VKESAAGLRETPPLLIQKNDFAEKKIFIYILA